MKKQVQRRVLENTWSLILLDCYGIFLYIFSNCFLVGGLEHVFSHILGIIIPTDFNIFFRGVRLPPTSFFLGTSHCKVIRGASAKSVEDLGDDLKSVVASAVEGSP